MIKCKLINWDKGDFMSVEIQFTSLKDVRRKNKKKWPRIIFDVFIILFIVVNAAGLYVGNYFYKKAFNIETKKDLDQYESNKLTFNESRYNELQKEQVYTASKHDYKLYGTYIENLKSTKNTIILVHGLGGSRWSVMKYTDMYLDKGFNVLIYDGRDHGYSGGDNVTYGYYEKDDLDKWVQWVYKKNKGGIIGVHGESMGAVTALLQSKMDETKKRVSFYIADSGYSDLNDIFALRLKEDYKIKFTIAAKPLLFYANIINKINNEFDFNQVSPINDIKNVKTPIMFIHGANDKYIPKYMSEEMYKAKSGIKKLYIAPNSNHGEAYYNNEDEYRENVYSFIDSVSAIK